MSNSKSALTSEHRQRWPGETQVEKGAAWVLRAMDAKSLPHTKFLLKHSAKAE